MSELITEPWPWYVVNPLIGLTVPLLLCPLGEEDDTHGIGTVDDRLGSVLLKYLEQEIQHQAKDH